MRNLRTMLLCVVTTMALGCGPKDATPVQSLPDTATGPAGGTPGAIGIECTASVAGYDDYRTSTMAHNPDVCSVGGGGMLSLSVKGEGANGVQLHLADYHGPGTYSLTGSSNFIVSNTTGNSGSSQTTQACAASSSCTAVVTDTSTGAPAGALHTLEFAVSCSQLCDQDIWRCTATPGGGGSATWSFRGECSVPGATP